MLTHNFLKKLRGKWLTQMKYEMLWNWICIHQKPYFLSTAKVISCQKQHFLGMVLPALSDSSSPADIITGSTPRALKMSSVWNVFPCPFPPQMPERKYTTFTYPVSTNCLKQIKHVFTILRSWNYFIRSCTMRNSEEKSCRADSLQ